MRLILKPDWDPNNPYHYHVNGKKIVITPEEWEANVGKPWFEEIEAAVKSEQAAHPGPEYDEVENPAWRQAYQRLVNGVNLKGRDNVSQPLLQGYTRDEKGIAMDEQGNYYIPVETATNAPYFINQERGTMGHIVPVRYEQQQMPDRTIRQLRLPLPVDRVMNVGEERENAIDNYMANNFVPTLYKRRGHDIYSSNPNVPGWTIWNGDNKIPQNVLITDGNGQALYLTGLKYMGEDAYEMAFEEEDPLGYKNLLQKYKGNIIKIPNPTGSLRYSLFDNPDYGTSDLTGARIDEILRKGKNPTNQEAERKAVIKVGDLEKVGTFAKGGKLINKCLNGAKVYYNQLNTPIPKIINPKYNDFVRRADLLTYQSNLQNYRELGNYLPEGYKFRNSGLIQGPNGELYALKGYQGNLNYNNPFTITFYKGRPVLKDVLFYPINDVPEYMIEDDTKKYYKPIYLYFYGVNPNKESDNYYTAWFMTPKGKLIRKMNSGLPEQAIFSDVNNRTSQAYKDEGYFRALTEDEMRSIYNNLRNYNKGLSSLYLLQEFPTVDDYLNYGLIKKEDEEINL